jgi:hypothetical protein
LSIVLIQKNSSELIKIIAKFLVASIFIKNNFN